MPQLLLDAGDLLFKSPLIPKRDNSIAMIKAHGITRAYMQMGLDAVAVSSTDLSAGQSFFNSSQQEQFPWISSNVFDKDGNYAFSPHRVIKIGSLLVCVIGLTDGRRQDLTEYTINEWQNALEVQLEDLTEECDLLILLSTLDNENNKTIALKYPQIDIIISADKRRGNVRPYLSGNTLLTQVANRGRYLGQLDIDYSSGGKWQAPNAQSIDQLNKKLSTIENHIKQLHGRIEISDTNAKKTLSTRVQHFDREKAKIIEQLRVRKEELKQTAAVVKNTFQYNFKKITPSLSSPDIEKVVRQINKNVNNHNKGKKKRKLTQYDKNILLLDKTVGYKTCTGCHEKQATFWQSTAHASAFSTLEENGQSYNTDCLPCHVTPGVITTKSPDTVKSLLLTLSTDRKTIGCEVCHVSSLNHAKSPETYLPKNGPDKALCLNCHTEAMDSGFNFKDKRQRITCPSD